jgi:hypothetical protein
MVAREINLEEKRVYIPIPMIQELLFSLPVAAAQTMQDIEVTVYMSRKLEARQPARKHEFLAWPEPGPA